MKSQSQFHLDEEQINLAVIEETDLSEQHRLHLTECQICRQHIEQVKKELFMLGEHARSFVPPMRETVKLPAEESVSAGRNHDWFPSFAVAVMTGVILFIYFLGVENKPPQIADVESPEVQPIELTIEDEYLMDEIFQMVEYPLPDVIYEITGDNEEDFDEFWEYLVPDDQDDFQS